MSTPNYLGQTEAEESLKALLPVYQDDSGDYDSARLVADINSAEAEVDASVRSRYAVPATGTATVQFLGGLTLSLVRNLAYSRLADSETPMVVLSQAKAARVTLRDIASGRLDLPDEAENAASGLGQYFRTTANTPQMTREKLEGF